MLHTQVITKIRVNSSLIKTSMMDSQHSTLVNAKWQASQWWTSGDSVNTGLDSIQKYLQAIGSYQHTQIQF